MITVYKYQLNPMYGGIYMPIGAELLSVAFQDGIFCLWAKVDTEKEKETRWIKVFGTGHEIPEYFDSNYKFIGTGFLEGMVFHAFEQVSI